MSRVLILSAAALALAGCMGGGGGGRTTVSAAQEVPSDAMGAACHAAVAAAVGRSGNDVILYDRRGAEGGMELRATVAGQSRQWRCIVGPDGSLTSAAPL